MNALRHLLQRAMSAPDDVSRVEDSHGNVATIERDSRLPGTLRVEVRRPGVEIPALEHVTIPAADERHDYLPHDVPFFPGLSCTVARRRDVLKVGWRDSEEVERSMPSSLRAALERRLENPPGDGEVSLLSFAQTLDDSAAVEWVRARERRTTPGPGTIDRFEALMAAYVGEGWQIEDVPSETQHVARIVRCVGPRRSSTLVLSSFGGVDSIGVTEVPNTPSDEEG